MDGRALSVQSVGSTVMYTRKGDCARRIELGVCASCSRTDEAWREYAHAVLPHAGHDLVRKRECRVSTEKGEKGPKEGSGDGMRDL